MPGTFQEAVKLPDAELRRAGAKKEMDSLEGLQGLQADSSLDSSSWDTCIQVEVGVESQG